MGQPKLPTRYALKKARLLSFMCLGAVVSVFLSSCVNQSAELPHLNGTWKSSFNDIQIIEKWSKKGNSLVGTTIWELDSNRRVDHLRIALQEDTLIYSLKMDGKTAIHFRCTEPFSDTLVFINESNDFPKRIVYIQPKGKKMKAWIDSNEEDPNRITFTFEKIHQ